MSMNSFHILEVLRQNLRQGGQKAVLNVRTHLSYIFWLKRMWCTVNRQFAHLSSNIVHRLVIILVIESGVSVLWHNVIEIGFKCLWLCSWQLELFSTWLRAMLSNDNRITCAVIRGLTPSMMCIRNYANTGSWSAKVQYTFECISLGSSVLSFNAVDFKCGFWLWDWMSG